MMESYENLLNEVRETGKKYTEVLRGSAEQLTVGKNLLSALNRLISQSIELGRSPTAGDPNSDAEKSLVDLFKDNREWAETRKQELITELKASGFATKEII